MTTLAEVAQNWKGYPCRIAVIVHRDMSRKRHEKLWGMKFIRRYKSKVNRPRRRLSNV